MNKVRLVWLITPLLLSACSLIPREESAITDEPQMPCEEFRRAEDEKLQLQQQLSDLQRRREEEKKKLHAQLAERQRQLLEEQRKVEELEAKLASLEKKVAALRRIERETLHKALRR